MKSDERRKTAVRVADSALLGQYKSAEHNVMFERINHGFEAGHDTGGAFNQCARSRIVMVDIPVGKTGAGCKS